MPLDVLKAVAQSCSRHQLTEALLAWSSRWLDHAFGVASKDERYLIVALAMDFGVHPLRDNPNVGLWKFCHSRGITGHCLTGMSRVHPNIVHLPDLPTQTQVAAITRNLK
jgi:hypothetical protein